MSTFSPEAPVPNPESPRQLHKTTWPVLSDHDEAADGGSLVSDGWENYAPMTEEELAKIREQIRIKSREICTKFLSPYLNGDPLSRLTIVGEHGGQTFEIIIDVSSDGQLNTSMDVSGLKGDDGDATAKQGRTPREEAPEILRLLNNASYQLGTVAYYSRVKEVNNPFKGVPIIFR